MCTVVEAEARTGTPNTVVYFGSSLTGLVFNFQVTCSDKVEETDAEISSKTLQNHVEQHVKVFDFNYQIHFY